MTPLRKQKLIKITKTKNYNFQTKIKNENVKIKCNIHKNIRKY